MNCYYHPDLPAVAQCHNCLKGICEECLSECYDRDGYIICGECHDKLIRQETTKNHKSILSTNQIHSFKYEERKAKLNNYQYFLLDLVELFYRAGRKAFIIILILSIVLSGIAFWDHCSEGGGVVLSNICECIGAIFLVSLAGLLIVGLISAWIRVVGELLGPGWSDQFHNRGSSEKDIVIVDAETYLLSEILAAVFKLFLMLSTIVFYFILSPFYVIIYVPIRCCLLRITLLFTK